MGVGHMQTATALRDNQDFFFKPGTFGEKRFEIS
jgi:hypothetical protein